MSEHTMTASQERTLADKTTFGFWIYLMTDCVVFASLFATFVVLRANTNGGPSGNELFSMPYILVETMVLLVSSFTSGLLILAARRGDRNQTMFWFVITMLLGAIFLAMELSEFRNLVIEGNSWRQSGFLSAYFTLVGTHGLHIFTGLIWASVLLFQIVRRGFTAGNLRRTTLFSYFWHFLDIVWIFIFTVVYLMGVMPS